MRLFGACGRSRVIAILVSWCALAGAVGPASNVQEVARAITELDVERAHHLLTQMTTESPGLSFQRARLAIYVGDCDTAEAILAASPPTGETLRLAELARTCARATAGSLIVENEELGVWIRFQDARDKVLAPSLAAVAAKARDTMVKDLGVHLPLPLRIDLVRDLFSLASVSGLPVEAAETTGTVAVARWGRITMLTPRAARHGYPWQDTLAHEITHLALARGSGDFAPLWLQEGIAKREETRWRQARPFDTKRDASAIARQALLDGTSVGIDRIGPSIAMLPTPEAAGISYAEVESFMHFWIATNGRAAFTLLLADLRGLRTRDASQVMLAVTGYSLPYWIVLWQRKLLSLPEPDSDEAAAAPPPVGAALPAAQAVRLGDLLRGVDKTDPATGYFEQALVSASDTPAVRFRAAAAEYALGNSARATEHLGELSQIARLHGAWLGLSGKLARERGQEEAAEAAFELAVALDPLGESAACEGESRQTIRIHRKAVEPKGVNAPDTRKKLVDSRGTPSHTVRKNLCLAARSREGD